MVDRPDLFGSAKLAESLILKLRRAGFSKQCSLHIAMQDPVLVLEIGGQFGHADAALLSRELLEWIENGDSIVLIDLSGLHRIDSIGIGTLIHLSDCCCREGGRMGVVFPCDPALRGHLEHMTRRQIFPIYDDQAAGLVALRRFANRAGTRPESLPAAATPFSGEVTEVYRECPFMTLFRRRLQSRVAMASQALQPRLVDALVLEMDRYCVAHHTLTEQDLRDVSALLAQLTTVEGKRCEPIDFAF